MTIMMIKRNKVSRGETMSPTDGDWTRAYRAAN